MLHAIYVEATWHGHERRKMVSRSNDDWCLGCDFVRRQGADALAVGQLAQV